MIELPEFEDYCTTGDEVEVFEIHLAHEEKKCEAIQR